MFERYKHFTLSSIDKVKEKGIKEANVRKIMIHDLKHSHASILIAFGANIIAVSKRLGIMMLV